MTSKNRLPKPSRATQQNTAMVEENNAPNPTLAGEVARPRKLISRFHFGRPYVGRSLMELVTEPAHRIAVRRIPAILANAFSGNGTSSRSGKSSEKVIDVLATEHPLLLRVHVHPRGRGCARQNPVSADPRHLPPSAKSVLVLHYSLGHSASDYL